MNMVHRHVQLNNTYSDDGSFVLHVSQVPPNAIVLTPGPALPFVVVNGVPSNGTMMIVGAGQVETQPTAVAEAPPAVTTTPQTSGVARGVGLVMGTVACAALALLAFGTSFSSSSWVSTDARAVRAIFGYAWTFFQCTVVVMLMDRHFSCFMIIAACSVGAGLVIGTRYA